MDVDPPVPPSSTPKKSKYKPKPRRKNTAPVVVKTVGSDDDDDTETINKLLRKVNERMSTRRSKLENKSSGSVTNGEGSSSTRNQPKDGNNKNSSNLKKPSEKSVVIQSSAATKDANIDKMLVDDEFGSSSDSDNEYKQPWDQHSYYPVSLPIRPLGSADPEILNAQEFSEEKEYEETKINSALELGLLEKSEEKQMIFFQFPEKLPFNKQTYQVPVSSKGKEKVKSSSSLKQETSNKFATLKDLPDGHMGKMLVYKSGAIKFKLGDTIFNVHSGTPHAFQQDAAVMDTKSKNCCVLGPIDKPAVVTPDVDSILDYINQEE